MSDVLEQARKSIEKRLHELESEAARLRKALAGIAGSSRDGSSPSRSSGSSSSRRRRGTRAQRAPRGQREAQFLSYLEKHPGAKASEAAKSMGVAPNQVYGLAGRLHKAGKISKRRGGGYAVRASATKS